VLGRVRPPGGGGVLVVACFNPPDYVDSVAPGPSTALVSPETTPPSAPAAAPPVTPAHLDQGLLDTHLIQAAWKNHGTLARHLIAQGADVNAKDSTQQSAYLVATSEGDLDLLDLTLAHGADHAAKDS